MCVRFGETFELTQKSPHSLIHVRVLRRGGEMFDLRINVLQPLFPPSSPPHPRISPTYPHTIHRGGGVFDLSIKALQLLNSLGYGKEGSGLVLDLVYNPVGPFLPPAQGKLEEAYKISAFNPAAVGNVMSVPCLCFRPGSNGQRDVPKPDGCSSNVPLCCLPFPPTLSAASLPSPTQVSAFDPAAMGNVMCRNLMAVPQMCPCAAFPSLPLSLLPLSPHQH
ncbi:unnamed protein product, partial [Closterium sp. Naga37s-1]